MTIRRIACLISAGVLLCATPGVRSQSSGSYTLTDLGAPLGSIFPESWASDINELGQIVGRNNGRSVIWQNGEMTDMGSPPSVGGPPFFNGNPQGINLSGQVVGGGGFVGVGFRAFLWQDNLWTNLGTLGGTVSGAQAISPSGEIVGLARATSELMHAFVWRDNVMIALEPPKAGWSEAHDINASGQIVGEGTVPDGGYHALLWQGGWATDLGTLGGTYSRALAINVSGQIVGLSYRTDHSGPYAFLWENGAMTDLGSLRGAPTQANDINASGQIVGTALSFVDFEEGAAIAAVLWENGRITDLNTLLPEDSGWVLVSAEAINDAGQIVGWGYLNSSNRRRAFLLTPSTSVPWSPSPEGTEVPPHTRVIDATGAVWTLGGAGETLRNGVHAAGGYARALLWSGGALYASGYDNRWWRWNGSEWVVHGTSKPGTAPAIPSPDGTEVPPANNVIDTSGATWTLGAGGETARDALQAGGGYARSLLWSGGTLYAFGYDNQWWQWNGSWWTLPAATNAD